MWIDVLEVIFLVIYISELVMRIAAYGRGSDSHNSPLGPMGCAPELKKFTPGAPGAHGVNFKTVQDLSEPYRTFQSFGRTFQDLSEHFRTFQNLA